MGDDFSLTHLQSGGHPVQEGEISEYVEINKFSDEISGAPGTAPSAIDVQFGEVNSVINGLDSQQSESQKKDEGSEDVD